MVYKTNKKGKPKHAQYVEVTFKLTKQQRKSIKEFCRDHNMTLNKLIKNNLRRYLNYHAIEKPIVHPRQLDLWNEAADVSITK